MLDLLVNLAEYSVIVFMLALFFLFFAALEFGYLSGEYAKQRGWVAKEATQSSGLIVGGMMTFLAFFLGMSLSVAFSGFQQRQAVIVSEANAIETAWLMAGTQSENGGAAIQTVLAQYAQVRLKASSTASIVDQREAIAEETLVLQRKAWDIAVEIEDQVATISAGRLIQSLAHAFNTSTQQRQAFDMRIPVFIGNLLVITATLALLLIGFHIGMLGPRLWFASGVLVITVVGAIGLISDLSRPYHGAVNVSPTALQWTIDMIELEPS